MRKILCLLMLVVAALGLRAQVVTTQPAIVQTDSRDIVITFHANQGNKGLMGLTASDKVYAHTGVITNKSASTADWQYGTTWLDNSSKYQLKWVATDTWSLTIPSIDEFYGIPADQGIIVEKLAFVFRSADGSKEGKTADWGDIFVDVSQPGFVLRFDKNIAGNSVMAGQSVLFTATASQACNLAIYLNNSTAPLRKGTSTRSVEVTRKFTSAGTNTLRAVAEYNGETYEERIVINVMGNSTENPYPGGEVKMGPVTNADGSVTFCIAAPDKNSATLVGSWNDYATDGTGLMNYQTVDGIKYFWTTVSGLTPGKDYVYYFIIDGSTIVGDPYARLVIDPWNDQYIPQSVFPDIPAYPTEHVSGVPLAVYNSNHGKYDWKVKNFKGAPQDELIIYELLLRDFTGTEGASNGEGTVNSAIARLDYIKNLGANAVELLPIMEFSGNNSWGYNPNFYFAPDKAYGTPDDYRRFIDECHKRGMAVILDIVLNHTDGLHPWYMMYDITANPLINATPPHSYNAFNDWKQEHPLVQRQWHDALAYWLTEFKADGFRFDLVKGYGDSDSYGTTYDPANNSWSNPSEYNTNRYNPTRVARMKTLHDAMRKVNPDAYFINENLATAEEENLMAADGELNWANINYAACQFAMGYDSDSGLDRFYAPDDSRTWGSTVSYAESHDEERMAYKQATWGAEGVKDNPTQSLRRLGSVAAQMILTPGSHMIWQFSEFGADQTTKQESGDNNTDPKRVVWSYLDDPQHLGLMESYRELCHIRTDNPQLFKSDNVTTDVALTSWQGRTLSLVNANDALYLVVNPSVTATVTVATPVDLSSSKYKLMSASYATTPTASAAGVTLEPGAYAVYGTTTLTDITSVDTVGSDAITTIVSLNGNNIVVEGPRADQARAYTIDGRPSPLTSLAPGLYLVAIPGQPVVKLLVTL